MYFQSFPPKIAIAEPFREEQRQDYYHTTSLLSLPAASKGTPYKTLRALRHPNSYKEEACRLQIPHVVKERVLSNFRRNIDKVTTFRLTREQMSGKDRASDPSIRRSSACSILAVQSAT